MMRRIFGIAAVLSLLLISCEEKGKTSYMPQPALQMTVLSVDTTWVEVEILSINAACVKYHYLEKKQLCDLKASEIIESGTDMPSKRFVIEGLSDDTEYHLFAAATGDDGQFSQVQKDTIVTLKSAKVPDEPPVPEEPDVPIVPEPDPEPEPEPEDPIDRMPDAYGRYWWEQSRTSLPKFADMALCYGGHSARNPQKWTKERFEKTVVYTDRNGKRHWFFDAMLMLEIWDDDYKVSYSVSTDGLDSSKKSHWEGLLDYWFADNTGFQALDDCISENAARIGDPPTPRYIVFALPDPVYFENYSKGVSGSNKNTVYWGTIDGVKMDFSMVDHMLNAYKWYIDQIRERFAQKNYRHIELLGFYILSETLTMKGGWRYEYKKHEELIPKVAYYCHSFNEGLYWIPYSVGDTEHNNALKNWKKFGFDLAILQPNYYWEDKSWSATCTYINNYDMGMEFEFEGSHGGRTSILGNSSTAKTNKSRFREYMTNARNYGIYGKKPIVLYTGTNALYELATSSDASDQELYHEFGKFIIESSLKKK